MSQTRAIVDKLLTNVSSALIPEGYVSEELLPQINVVQTTGKLAKYGTNHLRIETTVTGGRGQYRRVETQSRTTTSYQVDGHGLEGLVTQDDYRNVEQPYDAERDESLGLSTVLWLGKEKGLADTLTSTAVLSQNTTLSGTSQFNDYENSDPLTKFATARGTIRTGCGLPPNKAIMDWAVFNKLRFHPQMLDSLGYKYAKPGGLNEAELAVALGVQKIYIAKAVFESANEGQSSSLAAVWGKHIVFFYAPDSAGIMQTSLGYYVKYANKQPRQVYKYPVNNPPESTGILCEDSYDMLISNAGAGYLIKDAIALLNVFGTYLFCR